MARYKLAFIGCGNMGEAILKGIISTGKISSKDITFYEVDRDRISYIKKRYRVNNSEGIVESISNSRYILLAVKPQNIKLVLAEIKEAFDSDHNSIISIAAGISTTFIEEFLDCRCSVMRVMPNAPALFNKGMTTISCGHYPDEEDRTFTIELMETLGKCMVIDEDLQNISTAINGSGPAYFFLFCKFLIKAAVEKGIPLEDAKKLVFETMLGSGYMMKKSGMDIDELISRVASPGGTTEKALNIFSERALEDIILSAVEDAFKRSEELEENLNN